MIYILGKIVNGSSLMAYAYASISTDELVTKKGLMSPEFGNLRPKELLDALKYPYKDLVNMGYDKKWAKQFNKNTIENVSIINGILSCEVNQTLPLLDVSIRDIKPGTARGLILAEYIDYDTKHSLGFCVALYAADKCGFNVGRVTAQVLTNYMLQGQAEFNLQVPIIANADVQIMGDGTMAIVQSGAGYSPLEIVRTSEEAIQEKAIAKAIKENTKQQIELIKGQKKDLGRTTAKTMASLAETAAEVVQSNDLFGSFTPEQIKCIQLYYMIYTKRVFECLKRSSRLDVSPEKIARLDSLRIGSNAKWQFQGILMGRFFGQYKCALGHKLLRAYVAECKEMLDPNGKPLRLLFGSTCAGDFFRLDSGDLPLLKKTERVMVEEVQKIIDMMNSNRIEEGWQEVSLMRHFVDVLEEKGRLDETVGAQVASRLRQFIQCNIPFPKSLTEQFLIELQYKDLNPKTSRVVLGSYLSRKKISSTDLNKSGLELNKRHSHLLFEEYFGKQRYDEMIDRVGDTKLLFDFIIESKLQGVYGWNPEEMTTGFRGTHNADYKAYYHRCIATCKLAFGFRDFSGSEFAKFAEMIELHLKLGDEVYQYKDELVSRYQSQYTYAKAMDKILIPMYKNGILDLQKDSCIITGLLHGAPKFSNSSLRQMQTLLSVDMTYEKGSVYAGYDSYDSRIAPTLLSVDRHLIKTRLLKEDLVDKTIALLKDDERVQKIKGEFLEAFKDMLQPKKALQQRDIDPIIKILHQCKGIKLAEMLANTLAVSDYKYGESSGIKLEMLYGASVIITQVDSSRDGKHINVYMTPPYGECFSFERTTNPYPEIEQKLYCAFEPMSVKMYGSEDKVSFKSYHIRINEDTTPEECKNLKAVKILFHMENSANTPLSIEITSDGKFELCSVRSVARNIYRNFNEMEDADVMKLISRKMQTVEIEHIEGPSARERKISASGTLDDSGITIKIGKAELSVRTTGNFDKLSPSAVAMEVEVKDRNTGLSGKTSVSVSRIDNPENMESILELYENKAILKLGKNSVPVATFDFNEGGTLGVTPGVNTVDKFSVVYMIVKEQSESVKSSNTKGPNKASTEKKTESKEKSMAGGYDRKKPPKEYDYSSVIDALRYGFMASNNNCVTRNITSVDEILKTGKPYEKLKYTDKKLVEDELANLVSLGSVDLSKFSLPFELNTFITRSMNESLFISFDNMISGLKEMQVPSSLEKNFHILTSVVRWNKMSKRQQPFVEELKEWYEENKSK